MRRSFRARLGTGLLALPLAFAGACDDAREEARGSYENEFGVLLDALGVEISSCIDAGSALANGTLTLTLGAGEDAVVSVVSSKLKVNGHQCLKDATSGVELTTTLVRKLVINGASSGTNSILIDLMPGAFGALFSPTGGVTVNAGNGAAVQVGVRGNEQANRFRAGESALGDLYLELTGDNTADVKVVGVPSGIVMSLGAGADSFDAQDTRSLSFQGATVPTLALQTAAVAVYGGAGNDTLEGGNGNDTLEGGDDNDLFQTAAAGGDGADIYRGGNGTDTVDYSARTVGVTVDINPGRSHAFVEGNSLYGKTLNAGAALGLNIGGAITYTSTGQTGMLDILTELNGTPAFSAVATASADDRGRLVIEANADGVTVSVSADTQGLMGGPQTKTDNSDADDGTTGAAENDDVDSDVENLKGGQGDDVLTGSGRSNLIDGGAGNDDIAGGAGSTCASDTDTLNGGLGDDIFQMGAAPNCADFIDGGAGRDTASYALRAAAISGTLDALANDGNNESDNIKATIEIVLGGDGNDVLRGGTANDELHGGPGNDELRGAAGNDTLVGGTGNDTLIGEAGDDVFDEASASDAAYPAPFSAFGGQDVIHGGAGANVCDYRRGTSTGGTFTLCFSATASSCGTAANDGPDNDDLTNCNQLTLDDGNDTVTGTDSDDVIEGGGGADTIDGAGGNDRIYGEAGDDSLAGGAGADLIDGGADQTVISDGGPGDDVCISVAVNSLSCEI